MWITEGWNGSHSMSSTITLPLSCDKVHLGSFLLYSIWLLFPNISESSCTNNTELHHHLIISNRQVTAYISLTSLHRSINCRYFWCLDNFLIFAKYYHLDPNKCQEVLTLLDIGGNTTLVRNYFERKTGKVSINDELAHTVNLFYLSWTCGHEIVAINLLNVSLSHLVPVLNANKLPF